MSLAASAARPSSGRRPICLLHASNLYNLSLTAHHALRSCGCAPCVLRCSTRPLPAYCSHVAVHICLFSTWARLCRPSRDAGGAHCRVVPTSSVDWSCSACPSESLAAPAEPGPVDQTFYPFGALATNWAPACCCSRISQGSCLHITWVFGWACGGSTVKCLCVQLLGRLVRIPGQ